MNLQEQIKRKTTKAAQQTDETLLNFLRERPGALSLYQLAQELGWSIGRVQKSAERLLKKNLISYKRVLLGGRYLKIIVPTTTEEKSNLPPASADCTKTEDIIDFPVDEPDTRRWQDYAFLYALNTLTFGISAQPEEEWHLQALFETKIALQKIDRTIQARPPEKVLNFYLLNMAKCEFSYSPKKDKVLVTVRHIHA